MARKRSKKPIKTAGGKQTKASLAQAAPRVVLDASSPVSLPPLGDPSAAVVTLPNVSPALVNEIVQEKRQKQRWINLSPNSKMRKKAAQICALKIEGKDNDEIAKIVGLAPRSLRQYLWVAGKNGWLTSADPQDDVDYRLAHRAVSNLDELLHARDPRGMPDKEITLATLRGTGIFRNHDAKPAEGMTGQQNVLQINIQTPNADSVQVIRPGTMQGTPAFIEGEKIE